jgi:hypothetical protein
LQSHDNPEPAIAAGTSRWHTIWAYAREPLTWILAGSAAVGLALVAGVVYGVWWLVSTLAAGLGDLGSGAAQAVTGFTEPIVRTITDPCTATSTPTPSSCPSPRGRCGRPGSPPASACSSSPPPGRGVPASAGPRSARPPSRWCGPAPTPTPVSSPPQ